MLLSKGFDMKILLTGADGFIGSNLKEHLKNKYEIIGIDIKSGKDILTCDLNYDVDLVIHLAGIGGVRESLNDPKKYWDTNVEGTKRILEIFKNVRVLVAGSSSQYEPHLNPYAASKNAIEYIPHPNVCFMRFHTVYGPTPRKNMFFDKLLNNKLEYVTTHERDFIHIEDMVRAIELLITSTYTGSVDIGTGKTIKISDIRPDLPIKTETIGERIKTCADTSIMKSLGFEAQIKVHDFLNKYSS
jgi:UDP-glucuronate 4-epimerase